jgi:micrococcal nuclease
MQHHTIKRYQTLNYKLADKILPAVLLNIILLISIANAQTITGKVVGVADGDTITVLEGSTQYKIRLYGIDTPERGQDFGNRAKQFTSSKVFGQQVQVTQKDKDRYGRVVGMVFVGNTCVNQVIVKAGLAWVYNQYCKDSVCSKWRGLEKQARQSRIGLWSHPNPIPPWDYRRGARSPSQSDALVSGAYHGNKRSKVFHQSSCKDFNCKNCVISFKTRQEAIEAGFRPCGGCKQ